MDEETGDEPYGSEHEVVIRLRVHYYGDAAGFNPDDVLFLAKEGIESHYEVLESSVEQG